LPDSENLWKKKPQQTASTLIVSQGSSAPFCCKVAAILELERTDMLQLKQTLFCRHTRKFFEILEKFSILEIATLKRN
jgi:hypothetical protein